MQKIPEIYKLQNNLKQINLKMATKPQDRKAWAQLMKNASRNILTVHEGSCRYYDLKNQSGIPDQLVNATGYLYSPTRIKPVCISWKPTKSTARK